MTASELVYFHGAHLAHVAAYEENQRLKRIRRAMEQARIRRVRRPVDITDASRFPNINQAIAAVRSDPDRWEKAEKEWEA